MAESDRVRILTPLDSPNAGAICLVHIDGMDPNKMGSWLYDHHKIVCTPIVHPEFDGLRITPNVYTTLDEIDIFAEKLLQGIKQGIA
jgi:selenocysteine lyase/cysteine desulfurase